MKALAYGYQMPPPFTPKAKFIGSTKLCEFADRFVE